SSSRTFEHNPSGRFGVHTYSAQRAVARNAGEGAILGGLLGALIFEPFRDRAGADDFLLTQEFLSAGRPASVGRRGGPDLATGRDHRVRARPHHRQRSSRARRSLLRVLSGSAGRVRTPHVPVTGRLGLGGWDRVRIMEPAPT